ncbi:hypothetical protein [Mitsuaria sp. GD03876]|uniref:hypothetical protein n=1 Tax=Mitsuaria sp. GD03876 TaxID=2975399 RepID=UPI002447EBB5|nr:hypothetical protein [Mitsuaria sp. GD03876]MDH0867531.1 hypothetical protein [Mitsuaria sp. GD03876]
MSAVLGPDHNLQMPLRRLPNAKVLWVAPEMRDPRRWLIGQPSSGRESLEEAVLSTCAFAINAGSGGVSSSGPMGIVDRYGGAGLAYNGGSGRSAFVNGFYVKGVGRTPLIGEQTDPTHSSGGAYLAECLKETLWSCILRKHFPYGAVPVLAILDTGEIQRWADHDGPDRETRCLLIRPAFLRPAHFERAPLFTGVSVVDGARDARRVEHHFQSARNAMPLVSWLNQLERWSARLATQLGFAFAHRVLVGGITTSNVDMHGRFADFGGFATVPNWGQFEPSVGDTPFGLEMSDLSNALRSLFIHHVANGFEREPMEEAFERMALVAARAYESAKVIELIGLRGVDQMRARAAPTESWRPGLAPGALNKRFQLEVDAPYMAGAMRPHEVGQRLDAEIASAWSGS